MTEDQPTTSRPPMPPMPPMPPEELLVHLPEKGIPATTSVVKPLVMLPDDAVTTALAKANLGVAATLVAEDTTDPERFINALLEAGETNTVLSFLAWSLPKRLGLWWAFDCCWTTTLDQERHLARTAAAGNGTGKAGEKKGSAPPPATPERPTDSPAFKDAVKKVTAQAQAASDEAAAGIPELQSKLNEMVERFTAKYSTPSTPGVASDLEQSVRRARVTRLKIHEAMIRSKAGQRQPKPLRIKHPKPTARGGGAAGKKAAPDHPLHDRISHRQREGQLRGMASCLQWILDPCQKHAAAAVAALPSIHDCPPVTALAKATFWCGENMSLDPRKPQVAPPATLPLKGISVAITKAGSIKKTSWTRADKTNWYLDLGLKIAAGEHPWDRADERFDRYMTWALEETPKGFGQ